MVYSQDVMEKLVGRESRLIQAIDEVSTSDIRHWRELVEGKKEFWNTGTAPAAMMMVWAMEPLWPKKEDATEPHEQVLKLLNDMGYTVAVGIALDQEYLKPVRLGDQLSYKVRVVSVSSSEEETRMGKGYKVNLLYTFTNQKDEVVSKQRYTVLKAQLLKPVL